RRSLHRRRRNRRLLRRRVASARVQASRSRDRGVRDRRRPAARRRRRSGRSPPARARARDRHDVPRRGRRRGAQRDRRRGAGGDPARRRRLRARSPRGRRGGAPDDRLRRRRRAGDDRRRDDGRVLRRARSARARRGAAGVRSVAIRRRRAARARRTVRAAALRRAPARDRRGDARRGMNAAAAPIRPTRAVVVAALLFAAVYIALDLNKLWALRYGADTGTFLQFLNNVAHGRGSYDAAEYRPHLQVHDSWSLLALAPLVAAFPYAQTLLIVQVLAIAGAALAVCAFARACGASARGASAVGIAYLLAPCAQGIAYGNFLENVFVPLLAALGALAVRLRALPAALIVAQLLLGLKEDQALFLVWFGLACALWWDRRLGLALAALALVNGVAFVAAEQLQHVRPSLPGYALHVDDPLAKLSFFLALLAPFAFAPLWLGRWLLLGLPIVAELTFNKPWAYAIARIGTHWTASALAAAALGAAIVVARRPRFATPMLVCAALCALTINDTAL